MKSFESYLTESVNANTVVVAISHDEPDRTYIIKGATEEDVRDISNFDEYVVLRNPKNLICFDHSDEDLNAESLANSKEKMDELMIKEIEECLEDAKVGESLELADIPVYGPYIEEYKGESAEELYKNEVIEGIKGSFVDGDSMKVYGVVDLRTGKDVVAGQHELVFYKSRDEFLKDFKPKKGEE